MGTNDRMNALLCRVIRHPLTDVSLFVQCKEGRPVIQAVCFGEKTVYAGKKATGSTHPDLVRYGDMIEQFLEGRLKTLAALPLDLSELTPFSQKVLTQARSVPWGKTVSYTELAARAGNPKACRAAATVMRNNRFPLVIPCHRVVKSDGSIGGFMGKQKGRELSLKRRLLEREQGKISI
jgi:O-6-methylguanine DNA methyltransferase